MSRRFLDSAAFLRPTRGVRSTQSLESLVNRACGYLPALPEDVAFSHVTAARLHGLPLSYAVEADARLHVLRPLPSARVRRPGVVGHRAVHRREVATADGLPVVGLADTWVDFGELVGRGKPVGLDDLIVLGDAVASRLGSVAPLRIALAKRVRPRGKVTLTEALSLIRVGSASPRETLARIMLVRCGLPEPKLNLPIYNSQGDLLGVGDLVWEAERVIGEYQGEEFHAGEEQRARDRVRRIGLEDDRWSVEEIWKLDLSSTEARIACVRRLAGALKFPVAELNLAAAEARFFAQHALDLALGREETWLARRA